jgi:hypothetical protein
MYFSVQGAGALRHFPSARVRFAGIIN